MPKLLFSVLALALALSALSAPRAQAAGLLAARGACPGAEATASGDAAQVRAMRCLIATVRRRAGRPPLHADRRLARAAELKAARMAACGEFSHTPCGAPFTAVFRAAGWLRPTMGENIAFGGAWLGAPRAIMRAWLGSPEHRANLLRRSFRADGVAVREADLPVLGRVRVWVQAFGR